VDGALVRPSGVGKTMLAIGLGLKAVEAGYRVHYTTAADLVARTSRAADQGRWENTMRFWAGPQVLIVDELGYLPMVGEADSHLFQVITRRYLHGSVILTTNRGIAEWGQIFEDTTVAVAILDRLLHYATVLRDPDLGSARRRPRSPRAPAAVHPSPACSQPATPRHRCDRPPSRHTQARPTRWRAQRTIEPKPEPMQMLAER
jgi:DNA replication protein DnaC